MQPSRILFVAPTRIGDAVLSASLLRHLLETQPQARVTIATSPLAAPLFAGYPALERIIEVQKRSYNRHWLMLMRAVLPTRWRSVWDLRGSALAYLLRTRTRHVFRGDDTPRPKVEQYAAALGTGPLPYPQLWPLPEHRAQAEACMPEGTKYLALAPIANWEPKEWPLEKFTALAEQLLNGACKGWRPVIICAAHERAKALPLLNALQHYHPVDLTDGALPLLGIYACMERAQAFVGNDSGLMHMAAAAGIPTLGVFGPTPSAIYQPWGPKATFIHAPGDDLKALDINAVADALTKLL